jgi:endoglucanase
MAGGVTTSEGQSYALFFALVNNDRDLFKKVLSWTEFNLAKGNLAANLPAWKWGKTNDGQWKILDSNSASDSDLWIAYDLLEAGRLWQIPDYTFKGNQLLNLVVQKEVSELEGLGPMLLPAPFGFEIDKNSWRLNPSYSPLQLFRAFESQGIPGPWTALIKNTVKMISESTPHGFAPDWLVYEKSRGFALDPDKGAVGSHDAIRTYLWAGMLHDDDPYKATISVRLNGPIRYWNANGWLPLKVDVWKATYATGIGTPGFFGAILPEVVAMGRLEDITRLRSQISSYLKGGLYGDPATYYDQNLLLFALGYADGRYSFEVDGKLKPKWIEKCADY